MCCLSVVSEPLESLGDSISTAVLLSWNKKPGDAIAEDDVIAVVETDKVRFLLFHSIINVFYIVITFLHEIFCLLHFSFR